MKRRCDTCEYWRVIDTDNQGDPTVGECRGRCPTYDGGEKTWPITDNDDWCGEWELKEVEQ